MIDMTTVNPEKFWAKVRKGPGCWEWTASLNSGGYGQYQTGRRQKRGPNLRAHRVSWEMANGPVSDGLCVLHKCDNRRCVNPEHLFLGTKRDNTQDMIRKGRQRPRNVTPRGSAHAESKLTETDVELIRLAAETLPVTLQDIASAFGICKSNCARIVRREAWRHVA